MRLNNAVYINLLAKIKEYRIGNLLTFSSINDLINLLEAGIIVNVFLSRETFINEDYIKLNAISNKLNCIVTFLYYPFVNTNDIFRQVRKLKNNVIEVNSLSNIQEYDIASLCDTLIIVAHGEGAHLKLKNTVLCGCKHNNNESIPCRKANAGEIVPLNKTNANNYIFFSCNSALYGNELYPDNYNLLFSSLRQGDYTIGTLSPTTTNPEYVNLVKFCIDLNVNFPTITLLLNKLYEFHNGIAPFICCSRNQHIIESLNTLDTGRDKFKVKFVDSNSILSVPEKNIDTTFRFDNFVISSEKCSNDFSFFEIEKYINKLKLIKKHVNLIDKFIIYLKLINIIPDDEAKTLFEIIRVFKLKKEALIIKINSIKKLKITTISQLENIESSMNILMNICMKQINFIIEKDYIYNYLDSFLSQSYEEKNMELTPNICPRCSSNLYLTNIVSNYGEDAFFKFNCPICGVYSISNIDSSYIHHGYIYGNNQTDFFIKNIEKVDKHYFTLYDKSIGKKYFSNISDKVIENITVDTNKMNPDVHSYKSILFSMEGVRYTHGKFIKK